MSLKPEHLKRYKDCAWLLFKYGRGDLVAGAGLSELMPAERDTQARPRAEAAELAADMEKLGPTFIKLGQLLSTRPDLVPPAYAQALARLQDDVAPFAFAEVERIIAEELGGACPRPSASSRRRRLPPPRSRRCIARGRVTDARSR